jgi:hypothetical protein
MVDEFSAGFVIFNLKGQSLVPDVPARTRDTTHCPLLIPIGLNQKFVGLQAFHTLIILWSEAKERIRLGALKREAARRAKKLAT